VRPAHRRGALRPRRGRHPRLLQRLDWSALAAARPKPLAGLSDITTLHQALARRLAVATLWSPMPCTTVLCGPSADATSRDRLAAALLRPGSAALSAGLGLVWVLVVGNLLRGAPQLLTELQVVTDVLPGTAAGSLAAAVATVAIVQRRDV